MSLKIYILIFFFRQRQMELKKNTQVIHDAENKSTDPQNSVEPDIINSKIMHCFHQIEEEQTDHNEKEMETYDEEGIHNETIEYVKDKKDLISINIANKNVEATEEYKEEDTSNEIIEYCEDNKNLSFINIDNIDNIENIENIEDCEGKSTYNQSIEYSKEEIINSNCSVNGCNISEKIPLGRCIINFSFFLNELHNVFDNHARGIDCQFEYWKFINYRRRGLLTQFFFKCEMCHYQASIWSEPIGKTLDLNAAVVSKSVAAGIGYSQLRQLFASMDIVCMSDKTYRKHRENLVTIQKDVVKNTKNEFISNEN